MNSKKIIEAVQNAIAQGAVARPLLGSPRPTDMDLIQSDVDVGISGPALASYCDALRVIPELARLQKAFACSPTGGGISVNFEAMARLLLARSIASGNAEHTVERFSAYLKRNSAEVLAVMGISGVTVTREIRLGPDVSLLPISLIPPSVPRGVALGQERILGAPMTYSPIPTVLVAKLTFGPIFYWPDEGMKPDQAVQDAFHTVRALLDEARNLLGILGLYPVFKMFWVQPQDLLEITGTQTGWSVNPIASIMMDEQINEPAAESLAASYFDLPATKRHKWLRIPLDRLNRAGNERDILTERSISASHLKRFSCTILVRRESWCFA